jgi:Pyridoxamine 5'-phosphate oxidase
MLPDFPRRTIAVLSTVDPEPHAIPVSAPVRAGDTTILLSLHRSRDSLARLRENHAVALTVRAEGDVAFTARGHAHVIRDVLDSDPDYAGVAIEVEHVDDHRQPGFTVTGGVDRAWRDDDEKRRLGARVEELTCASAR